MLEGMGKRMSPANKRKIAAASSHMDVSSDRNCSTQVSAASPHNRNGRMIKRQSRAARSIDLIFTGIA
jgi:hypothetical protein